MQTIPEIDGSVPVGYGYWFVDLVSLVPGVSAEESKKV